MSNTLRILLVGPDYRFSSGWITMNARPEARADLAPLSLATLAALTPDDVEVDVWDEITRGWITADTRFEKTYDFVGVTGYSGHIDHATRVASVFRQRGIPTGVGGPGVSVHPKAYRELFDVLFIGEAEETWPAFIRDLRQGSFQPEYRQVGKPQLDFTPVPRWDKIDTSKYAMGALQTTRGCPFDCSFCDVVYLFGRKMRHKPVPQVLAEFKALAEQGFDSAFITDDEFVGDRRYARELLQGLRDANRQLERPMAFVTQATVNASRDTELLELIADAGMAMLFVGIETPNPETLKQIGKRQNLNKDLQLESQRIMSYGIALRGNTMVGFDEDDTSTFEQLFRFHQMGGFPISAVTILQAPHGTPLWRQMVEAGRVVEAGAAERGRYRDDGGGYYFNTLPKKMSRVELMQGYSDLYERLYDWPMLLQRNQRWLDLQERPPELHETPYSDSELDTLLDNLDTRRLLDDAGRRMIHETVDYMRETAPYLWRRMAIVLTMQTHIRQSLHRHVLPALARQIEIESQPGFRPQVQAFRPPVPAAFRTHLRELLPVAYHRLMLNLDDPDDYHEAVTRVFVDFLVRWGEEFEQPEPHHEEFLAELCDRTCAEINGVPPEEYTPVTDGKHPGAPPMVHLSNDLLRNLDLELGFEAAATGTW